MSRRPARPADPGSPGPSDAAAGISELVAGVETTGLPRTLGRLDLMGLGLGAMIGGGIFVLTGLVAAHDAGPAVVLSYALAGAVCALAALCYAELAAMMPVAGSAYAYARATMGELTGWLAGWLLLLAYALGAALVARGWADYLLGFVRSLGLPAISAPLMAAAAVVLAGALVTAGVRPSAYATGVLVLVKLGAVALFVAFGAPFVEPANWRPFLPAAFGWSGVVRGGALVFYAYVGFDAIATAAQEARSPRRDLPAAMLGSLAVTAVLYMAVALVLTGVVPYARLGSASVGAAMGATGLGWVRFLVDVAVLAGLASVLLVLLLALVRVLYAMARDRLLPAAFGQLHARFRTPWLGALASTLLVALAAGWLPIRALGEMVSASVLLIYGGVCVAVLLLRRSAPGAERPFRVPASPLVPLAGAAGCGALFLILPPATWLQLAGWLAGATLLFALGPGRAPGRAGR